MNPDHQIRWDDEGDAGEHGTVILTDKAHSPHSVAVYRFGVADRGRERYQREYDKPERAEYGASRNVATDGGICAGMVLKFYKVVVLDHGTTAQRPYQALPESVAKSLYDAGAAKVEART